VKNFFCRVTTIFFCIGFKAWGYNPSEGNISVYFGPFAQKTQLQNTTKVPASLATPKLGFGTVVLGDINDSSSLEIGLFLKNKQYFREEGANYLGEETKLIHITMGYRHWLGKYFSGSITFYSDYSMGDVTVLQNTFATGSEIPTSARDTTEYGFDFALQSEIWEKDLNAVVLDLRFSKSVTNKVSEDADSYGLMLGYRYLLQEK
jgi:hypothetical protein